ncbi:MAG TPA: tetratricopeptide repeat protein [Symbiobacteriaceae bacterium]|jgi:tetratricopeptide (TPR) repeat protein|nr:tetratricopeptide repeat protein [Symbiobacteriaceae bacterium]
MSTFALFAVFSWLMGSTAGRMALLAVVLWYLDNRYTGWLAALWAPVARAQRISSLRRTVDVNPSDVRAMVELGEHYLKAGKYPTALEYLERAMARGEDGPRATYLHGAVLIKLGRHAEGRARIEAALAQQPNTAFGEPYIYLLEEALATAGAQSARVESLVAEFEHFDGVEVLTRAGRLCAAGGRKDLAKRLLEEAIHNYGFIPKKMRRRERHWMVRARLGLMQLG